MTKESVVDDGLTNNESDASVMLVILTLMVLNATIVASINDDALTIWFFGLTVVLTIITGNYVYNKKFKFANKS